LDKIHEEDSLMNFATRSLFVSEEEDFDALWRAEHLRVAPHRALVTDELEAHGALMQPQYL
jgi:hypothetical protein